MCLGKLLSLSLRLSIAAFSHSKSIGSISYGSQSFVQSFWHSRAGNSNISCRILPKFKLDQDFIAVFITISVSFIKLKQKLKIKSSAWDKIRPQREKTSLWGFRTTKVQTSLCVRYSLLWKVFVCLFDLILYIPSTIF